MAARDCFSYLDSQYLELLCDLLRYWRTMLALFRQYNTLESDTPGDYRCAREWGRQEGDILISVPES